MRAINVVVGSFDFAEDSAEEDMLDAMAGALRAIECTSRDEAEKTFCAEAAAKCFELAEWFKENQP